MKYTKKRKLFVFWWVLSVFWILIAIACIPDTFLWFFIYIAIALFCTSAGVANYRDTRPKAHNKSTTPSHSFGMDVIRSQSSSSATTDVPQNAAQPERTKSNRSASKLTKKVTVSDEQRKANRENYLLRKRTEFSNFVNSIPQVEIELSNEKIKRRAVSDMPEVKFSNITRATKIDNLFPLVVIDTETTGISPRGNDIIEVSAIKYDHGFAPVSCFTTLLKPRKPIPSDASAINHITDDMVANSPTFSQIAPAFSSFISGCNVVGHNLSFDLRFLFVCGIDFAPIVRYFDTLALAKHTLKVYGKKSYNHHTGKYVENADFDVYDYKLDTLCEYYNIFRNDSHRSLSDCYATGLLLEHLIDDKTNS